MKKLIRSLIIASTGLFITATACDAASISFSRPRGTQLDLDEILDFSGNPGDPVSLEVFIDTSGIDTSGINTNPNFKIVVRFALFLDLTELREISFAGETDQSFPEYSFSFQFPQEGKGLAVFPVKMLDGLINDGAADLTLKLNSAFIINDNGEDYQDVTNLFEVGGGFGSEQTLDFQPVPEPTTIFGSALALGVGGWLKRKKSNPQNKAKSQA